MKHPLYKYIKALYPEASFTTHDRRDDSGALCRQAILVDGEIQEINPIDALMEQKKAEGAKNISLIGNYWLEWNSEGDAPTEQSIIDSMAELDVILDEEVAKEERKKKFRRKWQPENIAAAVLDEKLREELAADLGAI